MLPSWVLLVFFLLNFLGPEVFGTRPVSFLILYFTFLVAHGVSYSQSKVFSVAWWSMLSTATMAWVLLANMYEKNKSMNTKGGTNPSDFNINT